MAKRSSRVDLSALVDGPEAAPAAEPAATREAEPAIIEATARGPNKLEREAGIQAFVFHLSPEDKRRMKVIAAQTGLKIQDIGVEALNLWLAARGLPGLERVKAIVPDGRKKR